MKTERKSIDQFQRKFDHERRKNIHNLLYVIPIWLGIIALITSIIYIFCTGEPKPEFRNDLWGFVIPRYVILIILTLLLALVVCWPLISFLSEYNIVKLKKEFKSSLENYVKEQTKLDPVLKIKQQKLFDEKQWLVSNSNYSQLPFGELIEEHIKAEEKKVGDMQGELVELNIQIYELSMQLEVYDQVSEKNFWQYIKSMKWCKKLN